MRSREEECVLGVQQWAEVRRLVLVEGRSQREVARLTGLARDTVAKAVASETPPRYMRASAGSKLDPFKDWIGERLREDPTIQAQRLRELAAELGYVGGKTIFDDYVREVRPRFRVRRTFQRTVYRPGELVQCDLWEPRGGARPDASGVGGDGGGVLVAGDRRIVDLLQGGAGHLVGPGPLP
jgi:transposase